MKQKICTLLLTVVVNIGTIFANGTKIGDLYYWFDDTDQTAWVTWQTLYYAYDYEWDNYIGLTDVVIPSSVVYNNTSYTVIGIGGDAFGESSIKSVTIPNTVTTIGNDAFYHCMSLNSVDIPNSVTRIGDEAFESSGLTSVTIPNSVTSIGVNAFSGCMGLTSVIISNSITSIEKGTFSSCSSLTSVTIPNSVTSIGESAFSGCSSLTSVTCEATAPPTLGGSSVFSGVDKSIPVYVPGESVDLYKAADRWKEFTNILPMEETPAPCILASGTCGAQGNNLIWELSCDNLLTISGSGAMADYSSGSAPWYTNRTSITSIIINNGVTSIGNYAFENCSGLTSVTIPNSVTSIGEWAFSECRGLTSVTIPNSVTSIGNSAFRYCSSLTSVTIPNSVTSIGNNAFYGCSGLTSVTIPSSVTSIGNYAFNGCSSLTSVTIPSSVTSIGSGAFNGCSSLTKVNINDIAAWCNIAFGGNTANPLNNAKHLFVNDIEVTELIIPNGVTSIGKYAFYNCSGLSSVTIPSDVSKIGANAFYRVNSIIYSGTATGSPWGAKSVNGYVDGYLVYSDDTKTNLIGCSSAATGEIVIPSSVTSIGSSAFYNCSGLTSVTIPNSVTSIGESAFSNCTGLTKVNITDIAAWCNIAFGNSASNPLNNAKHLFVNDVEVTELIIPNGATSIGQYAFYFYPSLSSVTIPNSVTSIGNLAFCGCSSLTSVTIPNSVTSIGNSAFNNCSSLISVTIPNSVTSIGNNAFGGVDNIVYFGTATGSPWGAKSVNGYVDGYLVYSDNTKTTLLSCSAAATGEIIIPNSVTSIGERAFSGCSGLTSVNIPNSVTSIGEYAFSGCRGLTSVTIGNSVASIGERAFENCSGLTSVTIPNSVTSIGDRAFYGCSSLNSVTIPNSVTSIGSSAFSNCTGLTSVTIPNSITSIGGDAFYQCSGLTKVNITDIAAWCNIAFGGSTANPLYYAKHLFVNDVEVTELVIPNGVTSIGQYAFYNCSSLTSVTIPNSVTSIGKYAFSDCSGLTKVNITDIAAWCNIAFGGSTANPLYYAKHLFVNDVEVTELVIPNGVTSIGQYAFYNCSSLTSVTIPNSVTSIGKYAFSDCSGLTSVNIPNSVTSIGERAFSGCRGLTSVTIPNSVTSIGNNAFYRVNNIIYSGEATGSPWGAKSVNGYVDGYFVYSDATKTTLLGCSAAATGEIVIPSSVTSIGNSAFYNCSSLTSVTIPNSVTSIGQSAFYSVNNIIYSGEATGSPWGAKSVNGYVDGYLVYSDATKTTLLGCSAAATGEIVIPSSVTSIGQDAFYNCSGLTSVTIPNSVTSIGSNAFQNCSGLTDIYVCGDLERFQKLLNNDDRIKVGMPYTITINAEYGNVTYPQTMCDDMSLTATPEYGYHFVKWSDGNTANPRTFVLTKDTTFTAQFAPNQYTLSLQCDANQGTVEGAGLFDYLAQVQISATPNYGYHFVKWSDGNTDNPRTIVLTQDTTFIAEFAKNTYTISTESANPEWGTTAGGKSALYLDEVEISATPNYGYHFVKWSDGVTDNPRTFVLTQDTTFTAEFAKNTYTISTTSANPEWGTTAGGKSALYLDEVEISATPNYGYYFVKWSDGVTDNPRTFVLTQDTTFTAEFAKNTYTISTTSANPEWGTTAGGKSALYLDEVQISATPNYGYYFVKWSDGNTDNPRTIVLTQDTTFIAEFAKNTYTISTESANPEWGTTAGGTALYLDNLEISATPNYGYHFVQWNDGNTTNPRTVLVTEDMSYTATFAKNTYSITKIANSEQGSVSGPAQGEYLDNITLTVTSEYGYHFAQWNDGNTDNPRTFELTKDTTFTAQFAPNQYTLSLQCDDNQGTVEGAGVFDYLAQVQISATPAYGYHFVQWNDGNTTNPRTVLVTEDKSYTATFAKNTYSITKIANNEQGSVSGPTQGEYLDNITLTVTPEYGYHFAQWNDGNTDNPRTFELTKDTTFTAQFAPNQYTLSLQCDDNQGTVEGAGLFDYLAQVQISATPAYGYHFVQWNDGNTTNPRTVSVTEDKSYTATFAKNTYSITKIANNEQGSVSGPTQGEYLDNITLTVTSEYGYHFAQWNDGNTDNPRTIVLTQDTTFIAEFAKNTYTISTESANPEWGTTAGGKSALYLDEVEISATPNYGYHFVHWNDNNTSNPRIITLTQDTAFTAMFAKNIYSITKNAAHGTISGNSSAEYLDYVTLTVTPDYGYHFTQWSDGLKDNPRIFRLTQDTTFTAEFTYDRVGQCGKDMALIWSYDPANKVLTIGNAGEFTENMQFGAEAPAEMEELVIGNNVTAIGANAFADIETLKKVSIGESVKTIGEQAFYNCVNLETIFNYRPTPTNAYSTAFDGVDKFECILYVLPNSIDMYKNASVWRDFYYTYAIGAEEATVTTNDVTVEPQDNAATLTWPTSNEAASYTIEITKDGVVFCRLTFNANGQLTGIAFAPGRDGQSMAPAALMTANGLQFTVTGLNSNTQYGYSVTAKDANEQPIATYSGNFTTTSEGVPTGIDNTAAEQKITKILRNGEVLILRGDKTYTIQGQEVR